MHLRSHLKWLLIRQLLADVPIPSGIHCIEQNRHSSRKSQLATEEQCPTLGASCHTRVFSGKIKSLVYAVGANSSMTEPTINSTLYIFIEQVNFIIFNRMVLQFFCVGLSFCWLISSSRTFSLIQNIVLIAKDKLSRSLSSSSDLRTTKQHCLYMVTKLTWACL